MQPPNAQSPAPRVGGNRALGVRAEERDNRLDKSSHHVDQEITGRDLELAAKLIRSLVEESCLGILRIGEELLFVKERLDHGMFGQWIQSEFGWTQRTAQNYMRAAQAFGSNAKAVSYLPATTIYKLASPTATVAREQVVERIGKGELLPVKAIDAIVHETNELQKQARVTAKLKAGALRRTKKGFTPTEIKPAPFGAIDDARRYYVREFTKLDANRREIELQVLMDEIKGEIGATLGKPEITAPAVADDYPELPAFLDRRRKMAAE